MVQTTSLLGMQEAVCTILMMVLGVKNLADLCTKQSNFEACQYKICNAIRGYACFSLTEFTIFDPGTKLYEQVASVLIRITEPTKQMMGSGASNKCAHDLNLVRLKYGVECDLRC